MESKRGVQRAGEMHTIAGILLLICGVLQLVCAIVMLALFLLGASWQIAKATVEALGKLNHSGDIQTMVDESDSTRTKDLLDAGFVGTALSIAFITTGILALIRNRMLPWFSAGCALLCLSMLVAYFSMSWYGFAMIYTFLCVSTLVYAICLVWPPLVREGAGIGEGGQ